VSQGRKWSSARAKPSPSASVPRRRMGCGSHSEPTHLNRQ
jgi:hypothetical protein